MSVTDIPSNHPKLPGTVVFPRVLMSAASATAPSAPVVSIATMGSGAGGRGGLPGAGSGGSPGGKCCENGRPISQDPLTGQTICSCQYNPGALLMAAGCYPRGVGVGMPGLSEAAAGVYSSPYATAAMQGLIPSGPGADPAAAFYSSMGALQGTGYYTYDPFGAYPYGNGFSMDPNARRKNATRESTQTLKAWLSEHRKNPYPTKGEKIMLAIITKMTLTQVSTWFANARRRLKKENKMTWSPRNRCGDEDDLDNDDMDDDDKVNGDDDDVNDTNNNRDFTDDASDNDIDILNCGGVTTDHDNDSYGHSEFRKSINSHNIMSNSLLSDDCSRDVNVLDDDDNDSGANSGGEENQDKVKTSTGSAFKLVSPSGVSGINGHSQSNILSPRSRDSAILRLSHKTESSDSLLSSMRNGQDVETKLSSPSSSIVSQKPKIWSVADVVSKSSRGDRGERERDRSPSGSPHHPHLNGQHMPHPAFPTHTAHGAPPPSLTMARGMGLWNPGVVTSLANMAASGRYHPYGQGLFSGGGTPGGLPTARTAFPGHGLPAGIVPGLIGGHHPGLGVPHAMLPSGAAQPTDLRKTSTPLGRAANGSPDSRSMMSSSGMRLSPREGAAKSSPESPPPTAFKPVPRR